MFSLARVLSPRKNTNNLVDNTISLTGAANSQSKSFHLTVLLGASPVKLKRPRDEHKDGDKENVGLLGNPGVILGRQVKSRVPVAACKVTDIALAHIGQQLDKFNCFNPTSLEKALTEKEMLRRVFMHVDDTIKAQPEQNL